MGIASTARATVTRTMPIDESARLPIIQPARQQLSPFESVVMKF